MKKILFSIMILMLAAVSAEAQQDAGLKVEDFEFCSGIENMEPVGGTSQFFNSIEQVYCFTRITGATDTTSVHHVWYLGDEKKADVELAVKSGSWRTWSSKRMMKGWTGAWRVEVVAPDGSVLGMKEFVYKPVAESNDGGE